MIISTRCSQMMELKKNFVPSLLLVLSLFSSILQSSYAERNNVCSSFIAYFFMQHSSQCWYDFAASEKTPNIIMKSGYPFREYKVVTEDDYILTIFRIPTKNKQKGAVFLQHGLESSAFLLADVGYDVWIGNYRGNEYSEGHKYLDVSMKEYWDYSVDDIALKDLPTMIDFVKSNTPRKKKVAYIGHSWGATLAMMYCSEYQKQCREDIKHFFWVGSAYKLTHNKSPFRVFFPYGKVFMNIASFLNVIPELSSGFKREVRIICLSTPMMMYLCHTFWKVFFGIRSEIRPQTVPILIHQLPAGTSIKASLDFLKYAINGDFRKYDYGSAKNMNVYGTRKPPDYDISKIDVNVSLFFSTSDWATGGEQDANILYNALPENVRYGNHKIDRPDVNHIDLVMGPSAKELIFDIILEELDSID